ncbi:hypothetical protein JTB14_004721 [Gonioctena quinquepunctata]|nr:hypothetical protein JTB14_004721 [Gonioctena quinquepunctata]
MFIAGDYNLPQAVWSNGNLGVTVQCPISSPAFTLCETFSFLNLYQHNYVHNSRNILLDLIFSNLESVSGLPAIDLLHHDSIHHTSCVFDIPTCHLDNILETEGVVFDFRKGEYESINYHLSMIEWDNYLDMNDINTAIAQLYDILFALMQTYIPTKILKPNPKFPRWEAKKQHNAQKNGP